MPRNAFTHQIPRVAVVEQSRRNKFRTVDHRAAAHGQQEVDLVLLTQCDRLAQRLDRGIRFDAPELDHVAALQRGGHFVVDAVPLDRTTAEGHHHPLAGGNQLRELRNHPLAEDQLRGVLKNKIIHSLSSFYLLQQR